MMDVDAWAVANALSKWLIYAGTAAAVGGFAIAFMLRGMEPPTRRSRTVLVYIGLGCVTGLFAAASHFLIQVGAFADSGLLGVIDGDLMALLWQSSVGDALAWRMLGFAGLLGLALVALRWPQYLAGPAGRRVLVVTYLAGIGLVGASFAAVGHSAEHGSAARLLVVVHVLGVMWWVGALPPLWLACRGLPLTVLYTLMHRFGQLAAGVLVALLVCGAGLVVAFLDSPSELLTSPYGLALSAKLGVVLSMLGLAALHRWRLVPALIAPAAVQRLQVSIGVETVLAALVLALSAVLSTLLGPAGLG